MLSEVVPAPLSPIGIHPAEKPDVSDSEWRLLTGCQFLKINCEGMFRIAMANRHACVKGMNVFFSDSLNFKKFQSSYDFATGQMKICLRVLRTLKNWMPKE